MDGSIGLGLDVDSALGDVTRSRSGLASQTGNSTAKFPECGPRVVLVRNVRDGHGAGSSKGEMLGRRQPLLSDVDIVVVLSPKQEERPVDEDYGDEEMGDMSDLVLGRNVSEAELVQSIQSGIGRNSTGS